MSFLQRSWKLLLAAGIVALASLSAPVAAEDEKPAAKAADEKQADEKQADEKKAADESADDKDAEDADRYAVPKDASADELIKFIEGLVTFRAQSAAERAAHGQKAIPAILKAAAKVMELEKDNKSSQNFKTAQLWSIRLRLSELRTGSDEDVREFIASITEMLKAKKPDEIGREDASLARSVTQQLEFGGKRELAKEALTAFSDIFRKAAEKNEELKPDVASFAGVLRRMNLLGNEIEITGKTVDGKDFDWKAYSKGKVVLVDFWATWCGPCIAELPNVVDNYKKYHNKGFDVVGISLDTDRKKLEAFLEKEGTKWAQLFEDDAGWQHPVAVHYGIQGIPTVILVDQQGKVVSLNARGPELGRLLEKLLGPPGSASNESDDKEKSEEESDK